MRSIDATQVRNTLFCLVCDATASPSTVCHRLPFPQSHLLPTFCFLICLHYSPTYAFVFLGLDRDIAKMAIISELSAMYTLIDREIASLLHMGHVGAHGGTSEHLSSAAVAVTVTAAHLRIIPS